MARIWRIVAWIAAGLLIVGVVLGAAGLLTGASLDRMAYTLFGGAEEARAAARGAVQALLSRGIDFLQDVLGRFGI